MCDYNEIGTTCNTQMMDMDVSNYYVILGHDWKTLMGGYLSLNNTQLSSIEIWKTSLSMGRNYNPLH